MDTHKFDNTMGAYRWARYIHSDVYVHPKDIEKFWKVGHHILQCVGFDGEYLVLRHDRDTYRVKPDFYYPLPDLPFKYGDTVETVTGTKRVGQIRDIIWHTKEKAPMYFIRVKQRKISKRYWERDLRLIQREAEG